VYLERYLPRFSDGQGRKPLTNSQRIGLDSRQQKRPITLPPIGTPYATKEFDGGGDSMIDLYQFLC